MNTSPTSFAPRRANPLLNPPGSKLLRPDPDPHEHNSLPFVSNGGADEETNDWKPERPASVAVQAELGKRYGAAYCLFVARNGRSAPPLIWIVEAMKPLNFA